MAIDLKAILRLDDQLSRQMKSVDRAISMTRKNSEMLNGSIGNVARSGASGMGSVTKAIGGVTAALGGAVGAAKLFQSTIGEAMKFENQQILVEAMFDDRKLSTQYTKMIQKMAEDSPIMDTSTMMGSSKAFVGITKDLGVLKEAWKVAEKLSIMDPAQGLEGSVFALKEMSGADYVSLAERFEIPKSTLKSLKDLSFEDQLAGISKYLDKTGITNKTVEKMGGTTLSKWNQVKERMSSVFRSMGESGNGGIGDALDKVLTKINSPQFDAFAKKMNIQIGGAITKATDLAIKFGTYVQNNWSTIAPTIKGVAIAFAGLKVLGFLVTTSRTVTSAVGGVVKVVKTAGKVFGVLRKAFTLVRIAALAFPSTWIIAAVMAVIGVGILLYKNWDKVKNVWNTVWTSMKQVAEKSINGIVSKVNGMIELINKIPGVNIPLVPKVNFGGSGSGNYADTAPNRTFGAQAMGYAGGIANVRRDRMPAYLHEGERVLTKEQNDAYNAGNGGINISFAGANFNVRKESDIESIARELANAVHSARGRGA